MTTADEYRSADEGASVNADVFEDVRERGDSGDEGGEGELTDFGFAESGDGDTKMSLPPDLPKSLDDRKTVSTMVETEVFDPWQGRFSHVLLFFC